jgi:hypothetical protein
MNSVPDFIKEYEWFVVTSTVDISKNKSPTFASNLTKPFYQLAQSSQYFIARIITKEHLIDSVSNIPK